MEKLLELEEQGGRGRATKDSSTLVIKLEDDIGKRVLE
jgi:hypothetical protein